MSAKKIEEVVIERDELDLGQAPQPVEADAAKPTATKSGKSKGAQPFDPMQYLSNFDGRDYLEVKWRLLWLRSEHPDAHITTEIAQHNEESGFALFRAEVEIPGGGKSTGWGSETVRDFHDYIEAAETKALGRALASLGYGTQFCQDFDFTSNARPGTLQVVDAPVNLNAPRSISSAKSGGFANGATGTNGKVGFVSGFKTTSSNNDSGRQPAEEDAFDRLPGM